MKKRSYEDMTHIYGRIWILSALGMIFAYPIITCIYYNAWPGVRCCKDFLGWRLFSGLWELLK